MQHLFCIEYIKELSYELLKELFCLNCVFQNSRIYLNGIWFLNLVLNLKFRPEIHVLALYEYFVVDN